MRDKVRVEVTLAALVAVMLALAVFVGIRAAVAPPAPGAGLADEAARKKAFDAAMREGNLSLEEARYWRTAPTAAATAAGP